MILSSSIDGVRAGRALGFGLADAENCTVFAGRRLPAAAAAAVFDELEGYFSGLPTCAALAGSLLAPYVPLLACRGWALEVVPPGPDASDLALLARADFFIRRGYTDAVVASGDGIFAALADRVRVHVVSHPDRLSRKLAQAATSVHLLRSGTGNPMAA
ncbi:hypothetical protein K8W59_19625 [Nocardioides rotundus]|uniref:hypothetical protein n=1 Tax=Nocardioides rotundus TaxID=1774216 RepID=UPI001CBE9C8B|nr:hypothetical protein [Nocardioides rotundus]UAL29901.1 hypothetical protein K8W59_19625 [Nocardioides rotundus]